MSRRVDRHDLSQMDLDGDAKDITSIGDSRMDLDGVTEEVDVDKSCAHGSPDEHDRTNDNDNPRFDSHHDASNEDEIDRIVACKGLPLPTISVGRLHSPWVGRTTRPP